MWSRIKARFRRDESLSEEMEFHLAALKEERLALGDTPEQAERFARQRLGNTLGIEEDVREVNPLHLADNAARYFALAARTLLRNKGAYLAATGILALGIGMSVAIFSLVDAVLLRPLPFPNQESIEVIWKVDPRAGRYVEELAYPELGDLQANIREFEYVAVMPTSLYGYARVLRMGNGEPVQIEAAPVSHDFFRVLGTPPILGRGFNSSDEHVSAAPVVIISSRVWHEYLGSDPNIVGKMIQLSGQGRTVIGVTGPGAEFPRGAGLWIPLGVTQSVVTKRTATFLQAIARVKPRAAHERVARDVNALVERLAKEHPDAYSPSQQAVVTPFVEYWAGSSRLHLWILLGASLLLLAASILSASNLILSRTLSRWTEIATRVALGARRGQVLAQLGAESAVISITATVAGLGIAYLATRFLVRFAPPDIPRLSEASLNFDSICFSVGAAVLAAVACTLIPGWSATKMQLASVLREGGMRSSLSRRGARARDVFILAQATITVIVLAMASLFLLSYRSMMAADIGFANRDTVTMNMQLRGPGLFGSQGFDGNSRRAFYRQLLNRLRESPGVTSAAAVLVRPLEGPIGWERGFEFEFEAGRRDSAVLPKANYEAITPDYFKTVGTPMIEGRDFTELDTAESQQVVIISRSLADRIRAAGHSPLGHRLRFGADSTDWYTVVGVSADTRHRNITQLDSDIFVPYLQAPAPTNYLVIRGTHQGPQELGALVRRKLAEMDPGQAVAGVATIGELIDANSARHKFNMILLLWFAACAAILAATGIYSVIAEAMTSRKREIAIRIALGAPRTRLVRDMIAGTLTFVVIGALLGTVAAAWLGRLASELLWGVVPGDPVVLGFVVAFVVGVSLCAASWPAWSAVDGDPNAPLRTP